MSGIGRRAGRDADPFRNFRTGRENVIPVAGHRLEVATRPSTPILRRITRLSFYSGQPFYFVPVTGLRLAMTLVATRPVSSVSILPSPNCATAMTLCPITIPTTSPTMINIPAPP